MPVVMPLVLATRRNDLRHIPSTARAPARLGAQADAVCGTATGTIIRAYRHTTICLRCLRALTSQRKK